MSDSNTTFIPVKLFSGNKRWLEITTHIVVWLIIFSLPYLIRFNYSDHYRREVGINPAHFFYLDTLIKLLWVAVFYLNAFVLAPLFIYKKKYIVYSLFIAVLLCLVSFLHHRIMVLFEPARFAEMMRNTNHGFRQGMQIGRGGEKRFKSPNFLGSITFNLAPFFLTIVASLLYRLLRDNTHADVLAQQKQEENLKTELSFLRSQISPHFIFNILNNITALARLKSDELEPTVIKLSSLMRYMLYEANEEKVFLKTEIDYLKSYIELQSQRFGSKVKIEINLDESGIGSYKIEPMLLIPFVENAFKHGVGMIHDPNINIDLHVAGQQLMFSVKNKCSEFQTEIKDEASGIGFANVSRRLNLLYQKDHSLAISKELDEMDNNWFYVLLTLKLHS